VHEAADSYADIPYASFCHPQANLDALHVLGRLFGLAPAPADRCRVLELGCASGGNLLPLAELWPNSRFVGVDRSATQIASARALADELGLANVELLARDILELDADALGRFDYVICHGVFSWVPSEVQDHILALLPGLLGPHALALVSYNVQPGWHMREMLRELMVYRARTQADAHAQLREARAVVELISDAIEQRRAHIGASEPDLYERLVLRERELVRRVPDAFLFHEHLEHDNSPTFFHRFMRRISPLPLRYLCDTELDTMVTHDLPPAVTSKLAQLSGDRVAFEQYLDFVRNREFRNTVLCSAEVTPRGEIDPEVIAGLRFAMHSRPQLAPEPALMQPGVPLTFPLHEAVDERAAIRVSDPPSKAALVELCERWPSSVAFPDLLAAAEARLHALGLAWPTDSRARLIASLVECLVRRAVIARAIEPPLANDLSRPRVSGFNRLMAARAGWIAGAGHRPFMLDPTLVQLLPLLDGRDRPALLDELRELAGRGLLVPRKHGVPITSDPELGAALAEFLDASLASLRRLPALLA
jgi:SAM-dependent methyltransferase